MERKLIGGHPGLCVYLWIVDYDSELHCVTIHTVKPLFHPKIATVWPSGIVEPGPFIQSICLHNEGIVVLPFAHRISIPSGFRLLWQLSSVSPDGPPDLLKLSLTPEYEFSSDSLGRVQSLTLGIARH